MIVALSIILMIVSVFLPIILRLTLKGDIFLLLFYISPYFQLILLLIGYNLNSEFYNNNEFVLNISFYSTIISSTVVFFIAIVSNAIKGVRKSFSLSSSNIISGLIISVGNILYFLVFPCFVFSFIYILWGIMISDNYDLSIFEGVYYSFAVIYSLPMSEKIESINNQINSHSIIQFFYLCHVVVVKFFELVVIGVVITRLIHLLGRFKEGKEFT